MTKKSLWLVLGTLVVVGLVLGGCTLLTDRTGINQSKDQLVPLDELEGDGDILTGPPPLEDTLNLGTVTVGNTVTGTIKLYIERKSGGNTFANSATVTVTFDPSQGSPGPLVVTVTDSTITLPSDWTLKVNGTLSTDYAEASVQLTATAVGSFNHVVHFDASGAKSGGGTLTREENIKVQYTVIPASDTEPPTVTITFTPDGNNGWFITDPACGTVEATDNVGVTSLDATGGTLSNIQGLGTTYVTADICVTGDGTHTVTVTAKDAAGNEGSDTEEVKIDTTPPTLTKTLGGTFRDGYWRSAVTVTLTGSDATSGLDYIEYNLDGAGWVTYTAPFVISTPGVHTLCHRAYDKAGNEYVLPCQEIIIAAGCSHGYWKKFTTQWPTYSPTTLVKDVFSSTQFLNGQPLAPLASQTLLKALKYTGTSTVKPLDAARILMVQAIAAVLNQAKYGAMFPYPGIVINDVNTALTKQNGETDAAWKARMLALKTVLDIANNSFCVK